MKKYLLFNLLLIFGLGMPLTINAQCTLTRTSALATATQNVCINQAINSITYSFSNDATSATVTGLPTGVTGAIAGSVLTISGTPTVAGTFNYTVTSVGCTNPQTQLTGTITVGALHTLSLSSAAGTTNQNICINTAITNITYIIGGGATNASVTGLPAGISGSLAGSTFTINGTPTVAGTFNYTVSTSGSICASVQLTGTITVAPLEVLTLSSAAATNTQTRCINTAILNITYTVSGGATGATVTGLPTGISSSFAGSTFTIFGSSSVAGTFNYTVSSTGNSCAAATLSGTLTIVPLHTITLTSAAGTNNQTRCANQALTNITYSLAGGATGATVTGLPAGVSGSVSGTVFTISGASTVEGTFNYTITTSGNICSSTTATGTITISPGNGLTLTSAAATTTQTRCINSSITSIVYSLSGGSTSATVSGLPTGISSSITPTSVTISGTPSVAGVFNYTVTSSGTSCGTTSLTGTITVVALHTLSLTSAGGTTTQNVCANQAITNIVYSIGGGASSASVTGLPAGINANVVGNTVTISGASTATGTFNYTISTVANSCTSVSLNGTISVAPGQNLTLSSAAGTVSQTVCSGAPINNITYTFSGSATNASVTGLPAGVVFNVSGSTITISGVPTAASGSFNYTVSTSGTSCVPATLTGVITIGASHTLTVSGTTNQTRCTNSAITNIVYTFGGGATNAAVTGLPNGITQSVSGNTLTISGASTVSGTFPFTVTTSGNGCTIATLTGSFSITPGSSLVLNTAASTTNQSLCINQPINNISYTFGGGATSVTVTGIPSGVSATTLGSTVTISGSPNAGGVFNYVVTTVGGSCLPQLTLNGTITVSVNSSITLTSAPATSNQTKCINDAIVNITYNFTGGTTGVSVSGLPTGVTSSVSGSLLTISGTPSVAGTFNWTATTTGNTCNSSSATGSIIVNALPNFVIPAGEPTICQGTTAISVLGTPSNNPTTFSIQWTSPPSGVSNITTTNFPINFNIGSGVSPGAVNGNITIANANGCIRSAIPITLNIIPLPVLQTVTLPSVCSGTSVGPVPVVLQNSALYSLPLSVSGSWSVNSNTGPINGLPFSVPAYTASSENQAPTTNNIYVNLTVNGCTTSNFTLSSFVINPVPVINVTASQSVCEGQSTNGVVITTDVCGQSRFIWTTNNSTTGLPSSPTSPISFSNCSTTVISPFTALNPNTSDNVSIITITPSTATCVGAPVNTSITIRPIPEIASLPDQIVCSGTNFPSTTFSTIGNIPNSSFAWQLVAGNFSVFNGISTAGAGTIPSFGSFNTTNSTIEGTIKVVATANTCSSPLTDFRRIIVRPQLNLQVNYDLQSNPPFIEFCNGVEVTTGTINFTSPIDIPESIVFTWDKDANDISTNQELSIDPTTGTSLPTFFAEHPANIPPFVSSSFTVNAQFTIANSTTVCPSIQRQFEIRVNPGPRLLEPASSFGDTICNGVQFFQLDLSQLVDPPTASVSWSCNNGNIDGPGGIETDVVVESATIPSFQGQNLPPFNADVNANFTIFLSDVSTSCTTSSNFFRVKVRPKAIMDTISSPFPNPLSICDGFTDTINLRTNLFGQAAEIFSRIESGNWGSSFINGNLLIINPNLNGGSSIQPGTIEITPTVNGCLGVTLPIAVTTNPNPLPPTIISEYDTICSNADHQFFSSLSTISNAAYRWNMVPASAGTFFPDENFNNVLIDFNSNNTQTVVINLKTTDRNTTCTSSASKSIVLLNTDASPITGVIVEAALNDVIENLFFFKPELLQVDLLQWGFDDLLNMTSSEIPNANSQILTTQNVGSLNGGLNAMVKEKFTNGNNQLDRFLFWVRIESFGCNNKIYYLTNGKSDPDYPTGIKIIKSSNNEDLNFEVFPNPTVGQFSIKSLSSTNQPLLFSIYNSTGNLIIQKNENMLGLSQKMFDLSNQTSGLYFLRITDKSGNSNVFKIIKN